MNYQLIKNEEWKELDINSEQKKIPFFWNKSVFSSDVLINNKNISSKTNEINYIDISCVENNKINYTTYLNKNFPSRAKRVVLENDTIVSTVRPNLKCFTYINNKYNGYVCSTGFCVLTPTKIENKFLYFLFKNEETTKYLIKGSSGATYPSFNSSLLENFEYIKPSIQEQSAIASILSKQESIISNIETLIEKNEVIFNELSEQLLSGELRVQENKGKISLYKNPENGWKEIEMNFEKVSVPSDWDVQKIHQISKCLDGKRKPLNQDERSKVKGNIPYWGANSIVDYVNDYLIDEEVILLGEDAAPFFDKTKRVAFLSNEKIWPNNHIHVLKALECSQYLMYFLNYIHYQKIIGVSSRPKLTQAMMNNIDIFQINIKEQKLISNILINQESLIAKQKQLLINEKLKFEWLLDNLLSGNYLVKEV
jgi:restriction endonuclease S subunit